MAGQPMIQSIALVTLGVSDYERAKTFYAALGWTPEREMEETAFYQANGVILVLWARSKLADDMGITDDGATWSGIALAHNVGSRGEGDEITQRGRGGGAEGTHEAPQNLL